MPRPAQAQDSVRAAASAPLRSGDIVRIKVWREPDLTGDATVNDDGDVSIPRIGAVHTAQVSPDSIRRLVVTTYSAWLVNPSIEVTFLRRLRVLGAVTSPGVYPVDAGLTVADAVAMAGGVKDDGSYDNVQLVRTVGAQRSAIHVTRMSRLADVGVQSGDEIYVPERSWVSRNSGTVAASAITAIGIVMAAVFHP